MATRSDVSASKQKLRGLRRRQSKSAPPTTNSSSDFPNSPHKKKAAYKQFPLHINGEFQSIMSHDYLITHQTPLIWFVPATLSKGDARWGWHKDDVFFIRKGAREVPFIVLKDRMIYRYYYLPECTSPLYHSASTLPSTGFC